MSVSNRPLVITGDPLLLDDLLRLAAVVGVEVEVRPEVGADREGWAAAPLILVGVDVAADVAARGTLRRPGIVLVGHDAQDSRLWHQAVSMGAEHVVVLPEAEGWILDRLLALDEPLAPVVGVVGGRGGAGASTLAATLGVVAAQSGRRCALLDADPLGGGLDLLLGVEDFGGPRWTDVAAEHWMLQTRSLFRDLPRVSTHGAGELRVLAVGRGESPEIPAAVMRAALDATRRSADLVIVDLPRQPDAAARIALEAAGPVLLVVPAELRATVAAGRVVTALGNGVDLRAVVRDPAPSGLTAVMIAASLGLPLEGRIRVDRRLAAEAERGTPPGTRTGSSGAQFCADWLHRLDAPHLGAA